MVAHVLIFTFIMKINTLYCAVNSNVMILIKAHSKKQGVIAAVKNPYPRSKTSKEDETGRDARDPAHDWYAAAVE